MAEALVLYPERLFDTTGEVGRWSKAVAGELQAALLVEAPYRTGRLSRSIRTRESRSGPTQRTTAVRIGVQYAQYVIEGTATPITAGGRLMPVGRSQGVGGLRGAVRGRPKYTYRREVRGQAPNDFVSRAVGVVGLRHPALRGF